MKVLDQQITVAKVRHMPRIYLDLTTSFNLLGQRAGGILRTEREIGRQLLQNPALDTTPFIFTGAPSAGRLLALERGDALDLVSDSILPTDATVRCAGPADCLISRAAESQRSQPSSPPQPRKMPVRAGIRKIARKGIDSLPAAIRDDARLTLLHGREVFRKALRRPDPVMVPDAPGSGHIRTDITSRAVEIDWPGPDEVLWTCGHYGALVPIRAIAEARRRLGFYSVTMCYDLIRVEYPEWNPNPMTRIVWDCVTTDLIDGSDRILCISEYTRSRLLAHSERTCRDAPDTRVLALGCNPLPVADEASFPKQLLGRRFALAVGSVERRKNLGILLRIWQELSAEVDFDLALVVVGRAAEWDTDAEQEVGSSQLLGSRVFWFDDCPDDILGLLLHKADALLYPSFTEGWGLPVSEALAVGTPVVASSGGGIPEAAAGVAKILDPRDEDSWRNAVHDIASSPPPRLLPLQLPSWEATGDCVAANLIDVALTQPA